MSQRYDLLPGGVPLVTVDATSGNEDVVLPGGYAAGRRLVVRRKDSSANLVTVTPAPGGSIDGTVDGNRSVLPDSEVTFESNGSGEWESYGLTNSEGGGPPTGAAGGVLTGSYPAPLLAANVVGTTQLQAGSVTAAKVAADVTTQAELDALSSAKDAAIAVVQGSADGAQAAADAAQSTADAAIPSTLIGVADGVAELDSGALVPAFRIAGLSALNFGAAPAAHSHPASDSPDTLRRLGASVARATYDVTTGLWSATRASAAPTPGQVMTWDGNADPPADADQDDWWIYDASAQPTPLPEEIPEPTDDRDVNGVVLNAPTVSIAGQTANVSALLNTDAAKTFRYLQFALRRASDGLAADTGHAPNTAVDGDFTLTGSRAGMAAGSWIAYLAYSIDGTTWFDGPSTAFSVAAPATPTGATLIGRSGLPWNAGIFYQAGTRTAADAFAAWRNRPLDSIMYFTGRARWEDLLWMRDDLTSWPGYRIVALPFQPTGQSNHATAAGTNNAWWQAYGQALKDKGWDDGRTILRLSWESNGDWYDWAWGNTTRYTTATDAKNTFVAAWTNVVTSIRSRATKCLFNLNVNRGNQRSGVNFLTDIATPLLSYWDILGLDWYNHWPHQMTQSSFDSAKNATTSGEDLHAYCVTNSKYLWIDEWFPSHYDGTTGGEPISGGDDASWIDRMWTWMQGKAAGNGGRLIGETSYNDPGAGGPDGTLNHSLFNPNENPNASARYKQTDRWGRA